MTFEEPTWLNNEIIVFYIIHRLFTNIQIKGILDMDYFEEKEHPLQFFDENKELHWNIPSNPYDSSAPEYAAFNDIVSELRRIEKDFIETLTDCVGVEYHHYQSFNVEMESLRWE